MRMRALLLLTGIAFVAAPGFAQDAQTPAGSAAEPGSGAHQIAAPAAPSAAGAKEDAAGPSAETKKKQRIRYTFPPAAARRM